MDSEIRNDSGNTDDHEAGNKGGYHLIQSPIRDKRNDPDVKGRYSGGIVNSKAGIPVRRDHNRDIEKVYGDSRGAIMECEDINEERNDGGIDNNKQPEIDETFFTVSKERFCPVINSHQRV